MAKKTPIYIGACACSIGERENALANGPDYLISLKSLSIGMSRALDT